MRSKVWRTAGVVEVTRAIAAARPAARPSKLVPALAAIAVLAGCQGHGSSEQASPASPPQALLAPPAVTPAESLQLYTGSRLSLRAPLFFPPGTAALYFQRHELVSLAALSRDLPYCRLAPASAATRVIEPATFTVGKVDYDDKAVGSAGKTVNVTRVQLLAAPNQPRGTLSCQWPEGGPAESFLTSAQIQGAIGAHFWMALPQ
jgi:hypothetical protein